MKHYMKGATLPLILASFLFGAIVSLIIFIPGLRSQPAGKYSRPYPMPHQYWKNTDEFYVFGSGGQQGGFYVYGVPSMKYLSEIPVFVPDQAWGWTPEDDKVRRMLTNPYTGELITRGDTHHPALSRKNGEYDGKWLFINDKMQGRVARVDLNTFRTGQILWIPNITGGIHGHAVSPNTDLIGVNFEHEQNPDAVIKKHIGLTVDPIKGPYVAGFTGLSVDEKGTMKNAFQVWGPWHHDMLRIGWGKSDGWIINTTYNTERATSAVPMFARKEDYLYFWNIASIKKAIAEKKYVTTKQAPDVPVISWKDVEVYMTPVPLNPHGLDISPTGKYLLVGGKATTYVVAVDFEKVLKAIEEKKFKGQEFGVPIITSEDSRAATMDIGMGATHIEFDNNGYAYVGFFVDSDNKRVALGPPYSEKHGKDPWTVVDTMPAHYSVGHLLVPGGDSAKPYGKYLISMNKLAKDSFLPHGPLITENHELFNIEEMPAKMIDQMAMGPETHYSQAIPIELIAKQTKTAYERPEEPEEARVEYDYAKKEVHAYVDVIRSWFTPDWFTVPQGWTVKMKLSSREEAMDITHGLALDGYNVTASIDPGEVKDLTFKADKPGVFWYYCIWFCSELHMEMRGRMIVVPQNEWSKEKEWKGV